MAVFPVEEQHFTVMFVCCQVDLILKIESV